MRFVIGMIVFSGLADSIACHFALGWRVAAWLTVVLVLSIVTFTAYYRDKLFAQLFLFGLVAGFAELPADHSAVAVYKILVYPLHGPFVWSSPLYMPFSYIIVMVQLGYLSLWMTKRWGLLRATLAIAIFGGINVPSYEYLAKGAEFWYYQNCNMIFGAVPYVTIFSETLFSLVLPVVVAQFHKVRWQWIVLFGLLEGAWMWLTFVLGIKLLG